jgi:hypothetical protein
MIRPILRSAFRRDLHALQTPRRECAVFKTDERSEHGEFSHAAQGPHRCVQYCTDLLRPAGSF